ncbi:hypothetical protein TSUD_09830 [Trifolium subterraneum]|nr:hypothetical protein TSUD_09830 [Trifolium subterraneum]
MLLQSLEENCKGNYANIDPNNTKCLSDYEDYSQSYYHILVDMWANDENVRKALHVREGTKGEFFRCNTTLAHTHDLQSAVEYYLNLTHANIQALVYCIIDTSIIHDSSDLDISDLDMSIPHIGTQSWIKSFNMSIHDKWRAWFVEGQVAG